MVKLIFGTASIGQIFSSRERNRIIGNALDCGVLEFDTSPYYAYGLSEKLLGKFSNQANLRINTKFGIYPPGNVVNNYGELVTQKIKSKIFKSIPILQKSFDIGLARESVERSLVSLNIDCIDTLFVHDPVLLQMDVSRIIEFGMNLKNEGKIRYFGLSGNSYDISEIHTVYPKSFDRYQINYSGLEAALEAKIPISSIFGIFQDANSFGDRLKEISEVIKVRNDLGVVTFTRKPEHLKMLMELNK
jgi:aryl-alcohol dehydrogenase-like predicted oxidoreductase